MDQMLQLTGKNFKAAIINILNEVKQNKFPMSENLNKKIRNTIRKSNGIWPPNWGSKEYGRCPLWENNKWSREIRQLFSKVSGNFPKVVQQMKKYV